MLKKLKRIKWYWWLFLGIYITLTIVMLIAGDITAESLKSIPLETDLLPYIENYYQFFSLIQLIHLIICFTLIDINIGIIIAKGMIKDVKKEDK